MTMRIILTAMAFASSAVLWAQVPFLSISGVDHPLVEDATYSREHNAILNFSLKPAVVKPEALAFRAEELTIAAWVAPRTGAGGYRMIAYKGDRSREPQAVDFKFGMINMAPEFGFMDANGVWDGILRNYDDMNIPPDTRVPLKDFPKLKPDRWNFLAVTFNRGELKLFLNGERVASAKTKTPALNIQDTPLWLGVSQGVGGLRGYNLLGLIHRIDFFQAALSEEAVLARWQEQRSDYTTERLSIPGPEINFMDEYDPDFKKKLKIVEEYEKAIPACTLPDHSPTMTVIEFGGIPVLARDGIRESGMCMMPQYSSGDAAVFNAGRDFAAAGVNYFSDIYYTWPAQNPEGTQMRCANLWPAPGKYDFERLEARLQAAVDANPNVRIIMRIKMDMPEWWLAEHPEELAIDEHGNRSNQVTLSSELWLKDICKVHADFIQHLEKSRFAKHIVGYVPGGGHASEWFWYGREKGFIDYSEGHGQRFRAWLKERYQTDDALRKAWNDPAISLATAAVPSPALRHASEDGVFRDLAVARPVVDHRMFLNFATTRAQAAIARTIRANTAARKLVGFFYGYSMYVGGLDNMGFQNMDVTIANPDVDFFCSPFSYARRRGGQEGDFISSFTASLRLHGKLYWDEVDLRTHLAVNNMDTHKTESPEETDAVLWRSYGNSLIHGTNLWWFLIIHRAVFHSDRIMNAIQRMAKLDAELLDVSKASAAEIAVMRDEKSFYYSNSNQDSVITHYKSSMDKEFARIGAPHDNYLLSDIDHPRMPDYKVYIFMNTFHTTPALRAAIQRKLARNQATAIWMYAPGYVSDEGNSTDNMRALTGISFAKYQLEDKPAWEKNASAGVLATTLPDKVTDIKYDPAFAVADSDATILATLGGKPAAAVKMTPWGRAVYLLPPAKTDFLREVCRTAGVHIYSETGDILRANQNFVMLHTDKPGKKTITLPRPAKLRNLQTDVVSPASTSHSFNLDEQKTALFQILAP